MTIIKGLQFKCTSPCNPQQYDVYDVNNQLVGFVYLSWGELQCFYPDINGERIYTAIISEYPIGYFENPKQQNDQLFIIADKILEKINKEKISKRFDMSELVKIWFDKLYRDAIKESEETIRNEHLWELGYEGDEPNPHTENIKNLREYIEALEDKLKELE